MVLYELVFNFNFKSTLVTSAEVSVRLAIQAGMFPVDRFAVSGLTAISQLWCDTQHNIHYVPNPKRYQDRWADNKIWLWSETFQDSID